eukprot:8615866-Karenia_brevis.AAC.1
MRWQVACRKVKRNRLHCGHQCMSKRSPVRSFAHSTPWSVFLHNEDCCEDDYEDDYEDDQPQRGHPRAHEGQAVAADVASIIADQCDRLQCGQPISAEGWEVEAVTAPKEADQRDRIQRRPLSAEGSRAVAAVDITAT